MTPTEDYPDAEGLEALRRGCQPPGIDPDGYDGYDAPVPTEAAERVRAFISEWGDGCIEEADGNALYAPDTALLRRAAESDRAAERHWSADLLMQAADTIDRLLALVEPAEDTHTDVTEQAVEVMFDALDWKPSSWLNADQNDASRSEQRSTLRSLAQALDAAGLLAAAPTISREVLVDAMIASDALSADVRAEAMIPGNPQREPFLMFADAVLDVLATAPTATEWGVRWNRYPHASIQWTDDDGDAWDEQGVKNYVATFEPGTATVVRREVAAWTEVAP